MATAYRNVAKAALMNWPPYYSEEEAQRIIETESVEELEGRVFAMTSIKSAVQGIVRFIGLSEEETTEFLDAVVNGPENAEIFNIVGKKMEGFSDEQQLDLSSTIHDGWVINNSNDETFAKKMERGQLRQYAPLELIGWNEVESDLLFLKPILEAVGVPVNEESLFQLYHARVANYMEEHEVFSQDDLTELLKQGRGYYPVLPEELASKLIPLSEEVSEQMVANWVNKDPETAQIFASREQQMSSGGKKI